MSRVLCGIALRTALLSCMMGSLSTPSRAQTPSPLAELIIDGEKTKCRIVQSWMTNEGSLYQMRNIANDEMLTVVPTDDGDVRIIHWGIGVTTPPAGVPTPPDKPRQESKSLPPIKDALPTPVTAVHKTPEIVAETGTPFAVIEKAPPIKETPPAPPRNPVVAAPSPEVILVAQPPTGESHTLVLAPFRTTEKPATSVFTPITVPATRPPAASNTPDPVPVGTPTPPGVFVPLMTTTPSSR